MKRVILKYSVQPADWLHLDLPQGAQVLTVQVQDGQPYLWASVIPSAPVEPRRFRLLPTGLEYEADRLTYVVTFQIVTEGRPLIFHLLEETS